VTLLERRGLDHLSIYSVSEYAEVAAEIGAGIHYLQECDRRLRESRNAFVPAYRLSDDVYGLIFSWIKPDPRLDKHKGRIGSASLAFSQVCRRWRAVALKAALLWNTPPFRCLELAKKFIARANSAPLNIYWYR
jgi:hypothetical protein